MGTLDFPAYLILSRGSTRRRILQSTEWHLDPYILWSWFSSIWKWCHLPLLLWLHSSVTTGIWTYWTGDFCHAIFHCQKIWSNLAS